MSVIAIFHQLRLSQEAFSRWMKQTFGTEDKELQSQLLCQATSIVPDFVGREIKTMDHVAAALHGIGPRDALEGLLAVQMVGVHTLAMECMARAASREQTDLGVEVNINRATKLMALLLTKQKHWAAIGAKASRR